LYAGLVAFLISPFISSIYSSRERILYFFATGANFCFCLDNSASRESDNFAEDVFIIFSLIFSAISS